MEEFIQQSTTVAAEDSKQRNTKAPLLRVITLVAAVSLTIGFALGFVSARRILGWLTIRAYEHRVSGFVNKPAPEFVGTTVDGKTWRLADQRGRVVLIDFTATWCGPCVALYPSLQSLYDKYGADDRFSMVAIALDPELKPLREQIGSAGIRWPVLFEAGKTFDNSIARKFQVNGIPSMWVVDQDGVVSGLDLPDYKVDALIADLLKKSLRTSATRSGTP